MGYLKIFLVGVMLSFSLASFNFAEDYNLQYFLAKTSPEANDLSKKEKTELLNQIEELIEKAQLVHIKLVKAIQTGELDIRYREGKFWASKMDEDRSSVETGIQQLNVLKEKPATIMAAIKLYKSLKNLSSNFNAYNNTTFFSSYVGDLAPEMELWGDLVFYQLYLLPLARSKDIGPEPSQKGKKPVPKERKP